MPGPFTSPHTLLWDAPSDVDVAGYILYAGRSSGVYGAVGTPKDVGLTTTGNLTLDGSGTWYFAVKAYDTSNNLSAFSTELVQSFLILGNF